LGVWKQSTVHEAVVSVGSVQIWQDRTVAATRTITPQNIKRIYCLNVWHSTRSAHVLLYCIHFKHVLHFSFLFHLIPCHGYENIVCDYENNQQDALHRLIYYSKLAVHFSDEVFVHHRECLTVFTVSGSVHPICCRLMSQIQDTSWQQIGWTLPDTVNTVKRSWWWGENFARNM